MSARPGRPPRTPPPPTRPVPAPLTPADRLQWCKAYDEREANERARVAMVAVPMGPTGASGKGYGITTAEAIERMSALAGPRPLSRRLADSGAPLAEVCDQLVAEGYDVDRVVDLYRRTTAKIEAETDVDVETYLGAVEHAHEQLAAAEAWAEMRAHRRRLAEFDARRLNPNAMAAFDARRLDPKAVAAFERRRVGPPVLPAPGKGKGTRR
jgi:hypothetical protein